MKYRKLKKGDQITVDTQIFIKQTGKWHNIFGFRVGDFGSGSPSSYRRPIKSKVAQKSIESPQQSKPEICCVCKMPSDNSKSVCRGCRDYISGRKR